MNTQIVWQVPIYPHLKKFVAHKYPSPKRVYPCEEYTLLGSFVTLALTDKQRWREKKLDQLRDRLKEKISISLTVRQRERSPRLWKLIIINHLLDCYFKECLLSYITEQVADGIPAYTACENFLFRYEIDENEYSKAAAYKFWQRQKAGVVEGV